MLCHKSTVGEWEVATGLIDSSLLYKKYLRTKQSPHAIHMQIDCTLTGVVQIQQMILYSDTIQNIVAISYLGR